MEAVVNHSFVIWKQPNKQDCFYLKHQMGGKDSFVIQAFDSNVSPIQLQGEINYINPLEIKHQLDNIILNQYQNSEHCSSKNEFIKQIEQTIYSLKLNQVEKAVISRCVFKEKNNQLHNVFYSLCEKYKDAFVYLFYINNDLCMLGASPETLLMYDKKNIITEALGGTKQINGYSNKEIEEHHTIVHYIESNLKKLNFNYIKSELGIKNAGPVEHFNTQFVIELKNKYDHNQLINTLHPTPAVCGFPVNKSLEIIQTVEKHQRDYYAGYLGPMFQDDSFYLAVNLRCAKVFNNGYLMYSGVGINSHSVPEKEWEETENKLKTLLNCL